MEVYLVSVLSAPFLRYHTRLVDSVGNTIYKHESIKDFTYPSQCYHSIRFLAESSDRLGIREIEQNLDLSKH